MTRANEEDEAELPSARLCLQCAKHPSLKLFVTQCGSIGEPCSICGQADHATTGTNDLESLASLIRALVRYHFDEWRYNDHLGGDSVEELLTAPNPILATERCPNAEALDLFFEAIFWPPYPPYDEGVAVYAGYQDSMQLSPLRALSTSSSRILDDINCQLRDKNFFDVEGTLDEHLNALSGQIDAKILAGEVFYRARIGSSGRFVQVSNFEQRILHQPYLAAETGAPPPSQAAAGRANRQGVSFLYLSTTDETAAAEVRPHPGHYVSLGAFRTLQELRVAGFGQVDIAVFAASDLKLDRYHLAISIDREMRFPITPEERHRFSVTQLIADLIRRRGYDGIKYRSSVGKGANLCIFAPEKMSFVQDKSRVIYVSALHYETEDIPLVTDPTTAVRIGP